ncbi:phage terminase small subunit P27 family [Streptomyces sp. NPDC094149]|uniref:phage terminase small subunit P27 family n=1 Tax=Streptomyces sp. NPDC094149 TaxID=3155079 RepID=UPI003326C185
MTLAKPVDQHKREGTYRPDRHSDRLSLSPSDLTEPDWSTVIGDGPDAEKVKADASDIWQRIVPALSAATRITDAQREVVVSFCTAQARVWQAERIISRDGLLVVGANGVLVKNPATTVLNTYSGILRAARVELGLSPSAAARITVTAPDEDDDPDGIWD